jgi:hypothetical protein
MTRPDFLESFSSSPVFVSAELRPPRAELQTHEGMDAWIDTYHTVRRLTRDGTMVFLTDSAVGTPEEDNLRHLVTNLGSDSPWDRVVPFLTSKHPLDYCLAYADRAAQQGFPALVVLGGDKHVGTPRCVEHAWQLRQAIRERLPGLTLGGWANPHADPAWQADLLAGPSFAGEFYLTQIVSHHHASLVERFLQEAGQRGITMPGVFGVFYYRSANPKTLAMLREFLPVPVEGLVADFAGGLNAADVCALSIRALMGAGVRHFYISNLPVTRATQTLGEILRKAGIG